MLPLILINTTSTPTPSEALIKFYTLDKVLASTMGSLLRATISLEVCIEQTKMRSRQKVFLPFLSVEWRKQNGLEPLGASAISLSFLFHAPTFKQRKSPPNSSFSLFWQLCNIKNPASFYPECNFFWVKNLTRILRRCLTHTHSETRSTTPLEHCIIRI